MIPYETLFPKSLLGNKQKKNERKRPNARERSIKHVASEKLADALNSRRALEWRRHCESGWGRINGGERGTRAPRGRARLRFTTSGAARPNFPRACFAPELVAPNRFPTTRQCPMIFFGANFEAGWSRFRGREMDDSKFR